MNATPLRRAAAALVIAAPLCAWSTARADAFAPAGSPYQLWLGPDLAITAIGVTLWVTPTIVMHNQIHGPPCDPDPCDRNDVNVAERWAVDVHSEGARYAADALFAALPPLWLGLELPDTGFKNGKALVTDFAILAETLAWGGAIDEIFRRAVRRPRPYTYVAGIFPDRRVEGEANFSYYSGHTSAIFSFSVVLAYTWSQRHPGSRWRYPVWIGLLTLAAMEGVLRVWSGDHFPSDVIAGAIVGSGLGVLVPMVHRQRKQHPVLSSIAIAPSQSGGVTSFWLSGRF